MLKLAAIITTCAVLMVSPVFAGMTTYTVSTHDHVERNEPAPVTTQQLHDNENEIIVIDAPVLDQQGGMKFADHEVRDFYCHRRLNPKNTCQLP